ncbi:MAG: DUF3592 domain-containing protein [Planctomycetota bacterium]
MPALRTLFALLLIGGLVTPPFLLWRLPLTTLGWIFCSSLLIYYITVTLLLPDIVLSHRSGVMAGGFRILQMRLSLLPVRLIIRAGSRLLKQGDRFSPGTLIEACRETKALREEDLVKHIQASTKYEPSSSEFSKLLDDQSQAQSFLSPKYLAGNLLGAVAALAVLGFFFYFTSGLQHLDAAFIHRDWQETSATITKQTSEGGHRDSYYVYEFDYAVDGNGMSSICYGSEPLETDSPLVAMYDSRKPEVAVLADGMRVHNLPIGPVIIACISLLVLLPLPLILGHFSASIVASLFIKRSDAQVTEQTAS